MHSPSGAGMPIAERSIIAEAVFAFGASEAGRLQISAPRPMVVSELDGDLLGLFERLVEEERYR